MNVRSKARRLLALPVLEEWFKAVDPVTPPSFVTLDLDAKRAVTASPRGDLSAAVGEYILRDEIIGVTVDVVSKADLRRDYHEMKHGEVTPEEEVRRLRVALSAHPCNQNTRSYDDLDALMRNMVQSWKWQDEKIKGLTATNKSLQVENARLRISAATPEPAIRAQQIQQIATAIIQRDGVSAAVGALNSAIAIVDGSYRRTPAELIKVLGEKSGRRDVDYVSRTLGLSEAVVDGWLKDMVTVLGALVDEPVKKKEAEDADDDSE